MCSRQRLGSGGQPTCRLFPLSTLDQQRPARPSSIHVHVQQHKANVLLLNPGGRCFLPYAHVMHAECPTLDPQQKAKKAWEKAWAALPASSCKEASCICRMTFTQSDFARKERSMLPVCLLSHIFSAFVHWLHTRSTGTVKHCMAHCCWADLE